MKVHDQSYQNTELETKQFESITKSHWSFDDGCEDNSK